MHDDYEEARNMQFIDLKPVCELLVRFCEFPVEIASLMNTTKRAQKTIRFILDATPNRYFIKYHNWTYDESFCSLRILGEIDILIKIGPSWKKFTLSVDVVGDYSGPSIDVTFNKLPVVSAICNEFYDSSILTHKSGKLFEGSRCDGIDSIRKLYTSHMKRQRRR